MRKTVLYFAALCLTVGINITYFNLWNKHMKCAVDNPVYWKYLCVPLFRFTAISNLILIRTIRSSQYKADIYQNDVFATSS